MEVSLEVWRTCEHILSLVIEGNKFDYAYFQCTLKKCVHPEFVCPCDRVANLEVLNEDNQILP
ncbi:MAG: hypothetical protein HXS54_09515 [Theionarchaea archaeon]|nr:hypothetical protein [Theionarchaea archaeon]